MKKVMLVVIASLTVIVAIQFASTASSSPQRQAVPLPKRVAKLEAQVKKLTARANNLEAITFVCLFNKNAPPIPVTRNAFTTPTGGYIDITQSGQQASGFVFEVGDPKCLQLVGFKKHVNLRQLRLGGLKLQPARRH